MGTNRFAIGMSMAALLGALAIGSAYGTPGGGNGGGGGGAGGGGGSDPERIHFRMNSGGAWQVWTMHTDGTSKSATGLTVSGVSGTPSHGLHAGHRWYLDSRAIPGDFYPGGTLQRREYFAVRDDGAVEAQLTTQADLMHSGRPRWSPDDGTLSWTARRWVNGVAGTMDVYTASLTYASSGDVTGLAAQPSAPTVSMGTDVGSHDWSPHASHMVLTEVYHGTTTALWIADLSTGGVTSIGSTSNPSAAVWSPDGSKIAFAENQDLCTIAPDGSGKKTIVSHKLDLDLTHGDPEWSPDSANLVYRRTKPLFQGRSDIWRAKADGKAATNLTGDIDTQATPAFPLGWR